LKLFLSATTLGGLAGKLLAGTNANAWTLAAPDGQDAITVSSGGVFCDLTGR